MKLNTEIVVREYLTLDMQQHLGQELWSPQEEPRNRMHTSVLTQLYI